MNWKLVNKACKESVKKASKLSDEKSTVTRQKAKNNKITKK